MDVASVVQLAEAVEAQIERLREARPALSSRISRAENMIVTHLSCPRANIIWARVRGGELVGYLVKGSAGAVYVVEPANGWGCSCPDAHRRGKGCKHGLACWALWRASARPALQAPLAA